MKARFSIALALILPALLFTRPVAAGPSAYLSQAGNSVDFSQGQLILGSGIASCGAATTGAVRYNSATPKIEFCNGTSWQAPSATPAGFDKQVQLNNNGVLYASSGLTYNSSTGKLSVTNRSSNAAVSGINAQTPTPTGIGVYGEAQTITNGYGVYGTATGSTNTGWGVYGINTSTVNGVGVYGTETGASNTGYAVQAVNNSASGWGVYSSGTSPNYFSGNVGIGTTSPGATLTVNGSVATSPSSVSLTADNTLVDVTGISFLKITSNNGTDTNRTFCLKGGVVGQRLVIENMDNNDAELREGAQPCAGSPQAVNLQGASRSFGETNDTLELIYDGSTWIQLSISEN